MNPIRLAVIRYVPDPVRNEPRNVGVLAWQNGDVAARFVGENNRGDIDLRTVSTRLIGDRQTYEDWVQFWRRHIAAGAVQDHYRHKMVNASEPEFLDALASVTRGNYSLSLGGEALAQPGRTLVEITQDAFQRLVDESVYRESEGPDPLEKGASHRLLAWNAVLELRRKNYVEKKDYVRHYEVFGKTTKGGAKVPAVFDLGVLPPGPLFERSRKLLVDAVSFKATKGEESEVFDRARVVASKANEISNTESEAALVRVLVSNGASGDSEVGHYARRILKDEGDVVTITLPELLEVIPLVRAGNL